MSHDHLNLVDAGVITFEPMSQTDITPALTPDILENVERYGHNDMVEQAVWHHDDSWPLVMAIANHALPDGDPRKFTRADMSVLAEALRWAEGARYFGVTEDRDRKELEALRAKLAALLPPE